MKKEILKKLRTGKKRLKGFTLMELLVSIAIFSIISVLMSNIVLNIAKFSLENERREDFLNELDTASNSIKNDLRAAAEVGFCNTGLYYKNASLARPYYVLDYSVNAAKNTGKLQWKNMQVTPSGASKVCTSYSTPSSNPANPDFIPITSDSVIKINGLNVVRALDSLDTTAAKNTLLFLKIDACDPPGISSNSIIFDCTKNPYSYQIAISTRVIQ